MNNPIKAEFRKWLESLKTVKAAGGPATGTLAGALVVLERLKSDFNLDMSSHLTKGGGQIRGASGNKVKEILATFDETRRFVREGGRTNRGLPSDIAGLLDALKISNLADLKPSEREKELNSLQAILVKKVQEFHDRQRLKPTFDPSNALLGFISEILSLAKSKGIDGPVSQHLVGAKLQLRFAEITVENNSYSTADEQLGRSGDFRIEDTVFHITVSPMPPVIDKCERNLKDGLNVFLLVPMKQVSGTANMAEDAAPGRITTQSIEVFIAQNLEEISSFSKSKIIKTLKDFIDLYNTRVADVEIDKSMLVDLPRILVR